MGLVGPMPSGPGIITNDEIARIVDHTNGKIETFLLTSNRSAKHIIEHHQKTRTSTIQIVDRIDYEEYEKIKRSLPDIKLVQVIHVLSEEDITYAQEIAPFVDRILLDSGNPNLSVKKLGGTGNTHDWDISRSIVREVNVPVLLAGGLNPENVGMAVEKVDPSGVDVCSGVRTDGGLDQFKLKKFIEVAKKGLEGSVTH